MRLPTLLLSACLSLVVGTGCVIYAPATLGLPQASEFGEIEVVDSREFFNDKKIALIPITGTISGGQDLGLLSSGRNTVSDVVKQLDAARRDRDVRAIVLSIDSPGGGVTASDQLWREISRFKERTGKPVIAALGDVAASGGYYVAVAADQIYASPTTTTGSIGVITEFMDVEGLLEKVGVRHTSITSGEYKDLGSPFRALDPAERAIYQGIVDDLYDRFVDVISVGRPGLDRAQVLPLADGRLFTAQQALDNGLIDDIGYLDQAVEAAKIAAGLRDANVITYRLRGPSLWNLYGASHPGIEPVASAGPTEIDLGIDELLPAPGGRFLYLWNP